ncbi:MAG: class I SAM-dependent methyltransferase [Armatimonadota bacterium]|nr:class I SAM-dependent methyltransferase [Armatimonadota bacterium]
MKQNWIAKVSLFALSAMAWGSVGCSAAPANQTTPIKVATRPVATRHVIASATDAKPPQPLYEYRTVHDPDGTGKFYMGREIAQVMGHEAADWLDRPQREQEEAPEKMLDTLKIKPGDAVADIGAGSGYLSFRLARRVGPTGLVYANDIQPEMLTIIRQKMKDKGVTNIRTVLGSITDPKLPPQSVDLIILVDVYHEFDHPWEMTKGMVRALKPGGRLVFVEYRLEDPRVQIKLVHKMSEKQVRKEMSLFPLRWLGTNETLPLQHVIVFQKAAPQSTGAAG